jgi:thiol-disulfide isomerase/thioredoxin
MSWLGNREKPTEGINRPPKFPNMKITELGNKTMKNLLKTTLATVTLIGITGLATAAEPVEPKVVGLMFWAETCASCKVLDPKIQAVKGEFVQQPILFATFDHSNNGTKAQAAMLAAALGAGDIYRAQEKASGFLILVDAKTKQPIGKLTRDMSEEDIKTEINKALKS